MTVIERQMPDQHGIRSLVLAPLADAEGEFIYLLIRFWTTYPKPSGVRVIISMFRQLKRERPLLCNSVFKTVTGGLCLLVKAA
jgi:hypothetical protein